MKNLSFKLNWMSIVMLLSLGINFFVIGYIYAQHKGKEIRMTRLSFNHSISKLIEPLQRKEKHKFYVSMKSKRPELVSYYKKIMSQRAIIMTTIAAEPFDSEKTKIAMQEYHDSYHGLVGLSQDMIIKIISDMELNERQAILERYKNPPKRSYRDRRRGDGDRKYDHRSSSKSSSDGHSW